MIFFLYNQIGSTEIYFGSNSIQKIVWKFHIPKRYYYPMERFATKFLSGKPLNGRVGKLAVGSMDMESSLTRRSRGKNR